MEQEELLVTAVRYRKCGTNEPYKDIPLESASLRRFVASPITAVIEGIVTDRRVEDELADLFRGQIWVDIEADVQGQKNRVQAPRVVIEIKKPVPTNVVTFRISMQSRQAGFEAL